MTSRPSAGEATPGRASSDAPTAAQPQHIRLYDGAHDGRGRGGQEPQDDHRADDRRARRSLHRHPVGGADRRAIALEMLAEYHAVVDAAIVAAFGDPGLFGARELAGNRKSRMGSIISPARVCHAKNSIV